MNISQIEAREKELRARAEDIAARAKDCERKGEPAWMTKSIDRDMAEWRLEWDQVADERKKYEAGQAFMTKMGGNPAGQKGFDPAQVENKAVGHGPSPLDISVDDYKGLWEATKSRSPHSELKRKHRSVNRTSSLVGCRPRFCRNRLSVCRTSLIVPSTISRCRPRRMLALSNTSNTRVMPIPPRRWQSLGPSQI
jgi:hypothetical protein